MTAAIARLLNPLVWRRPGHAARKLLAFALAEQGSMIDMRLAARLTPSPARAAAYLRHADDEARHARMFVRRAEQLAAQADPALVIGGLQADSEALFERLGELDFLAFVHHGEVRARMQFETYLDYFTRVGRERDRSLFEAVLVDEQRHGDYTRARCWSSSRVASSRPARRCAARPAGSWAVAGCGPVASWPSASMRSRC